MVLLAGFEMWQDYFPSFHNKSKIQELENAHGDNIIPRDQIVVKYFINDGVIQRAG